MRILTNLKLLILLLGLLAAPFHAIYANDSLTVKTIGMELARDIANELPRSKLRGISL